MTSGNVLCSINCPGRTNLSLSGPKLFSAIWSGFVHTQKNNRTLNMKLWNNRLEVGFTLDTTAVNENSRHMALEMEGTMYTTLASYCEIGLWPAGLFLWAPFTPELLELLCHFETWSPSLNGAPLLQFHNMVKHTSPICWYHPTISLSLPSCSREVVEVPKHYLEAVGVWMRANRLRFNPEKPE